MPNDPPNDTQPMTPAEAAAWLKLGDLGYPDPEKTLLRWASDGRIKRIHVGKFVAFNLRILREYATRELSRQRGPDRRQKQKPKPAV